MKKRYVIAVQQLARNGQDYELLYLCEGRTQCKQLNLALLFESEDEAEAHLWNEFRGNYLILPCIVVE